jgi:hypothetical protein
MWLVLPFVIGACASTCKIESEPRGATISVNGTTIGTTPTSTEFSDEAPGGAHRIRAELAGYEPQTIVVPPRIDPWGDVAWPTLLIFRLRPDSAR